MNQMLWVEQRHLRSFGVFFVPSLCAGRPQFLSVVQAAIIPAHSHSSPGGAKKSVLPLSKFGNQDKWC